jgi:GxxExxY protein
MHADEKDPITRSILAAAFSVSNELGPGLLEKVYERALIRELGMLGLRARGQVKHSILYKGESVGDYIADLVVQDSVIVEVKCVEGLAPEHVAQCINYLKASGMKRGLLLNFQKPRLEWKRLVYEF